MVMTVPAGREFLNGPDKANTVRELESPVCAAADLQGGGNAAKPKAAGARHCHDASAYVHCTSGMYLTAATLCRLQLVVTDCAMMTGNVTFCSSLVNTPAQGQMSWNVTQAGRNVLRLHLPELRHLELNWDRSGGQGTALQHAPSLQLDESTFQETGKLEVLYIAQQGQKQMQPRVKMVTLGPHCLTPLTALHSLALSNCGLPSVPSAVASVSASLTSLSLARNRALQLSRADLNVLLRLRCLRELDLRKGTLSPDESDLDCGPQRLSCGPSRASKHSLTCRANLQRSMVLLQRFCCIVLIGFLVRAHWICEFAACLTADGRTCSQTGLQIISRLVSRAVLMMLVECTPWRCVMQACSHCKQGATLADVMLRRLRPSHGESCKRRAIPPLGCRPLASGRTPTCHKSDNVVGAA